MSDVTEDMRSLLCFFISRHSGVLMNASGNIDRFRAIVPLSSATEINQGHDKRGEI